MQNSSLSKTKPKIMTKKGNVTWVWQRLPGRRGGGGGGLWAGKGGGGGGGGGSPMAAVGPRKLGRAHHMLGILWD